MRSAVITIKKYPNRRLYDTSKSQYVNLEAVKELVMSHKEFEVVDSKTGEDLTKSILLQIITEQEANDQQALLTQTVLKQLIRFYGSDMQTFMRQYLEQSVSLFLDRQDALQNVVSDMMGGNAPLAAFNKMMEQNMNWWRQFADFDPLAGARKGAQNPGDGDDASPGNAEDNNR
jgi:polyhydroxyalkanoate synthesis repressor PhaR